MVDIEGVAPHYRIDLYREGNLDTMELTVEHQEEFEGANNRLEETIEERIGETLDVTIDELNVVGPGVVERTEVGKVKRVYDHRED
jgi:phenylacetate-CoA ligase